MIIFSSILYYMMTTSAIAGEMLPPRYSLSHDINAIVLNMHSHTWMQLTYIQQPGRHLLLALVYPFFLNFLGGAQKPREYGECQMLQLDRYRSLDVSIDHSKRFAADISNTMSWFRTFASCCHPWYIFQVIFLNHIVEQRLQKTKVFIMVVKIQSIKVMLLPSYTPLVDFITLCFITASVSLCICWWSISTSLIFIVISCVEVECSAIVFGSNRSIDLKVSFCRQGMIGK